MKKACLIILGLVLGTVAFAHTGGFTYEKTVGEYFVDVGASKLAIVPNELVLFEYNLYPVSDPNNLANFDRVYVTISDDSGVFLSTLVHRPEGMLTTLSYEFPKPGTYQMSARFEGEQGTMAEVTFPLEVQGSGVDAGAVKSGAMFALIGLAAGYGIARMRRPPLTDK
jgi:hypothetical protein